ncbi:MAG: glycosyltransferase family 4 protein [Rubrivivax sp.]|nr:glycosyltransferase family 4 protein [Rubrivivax sp.]
MMLLTDAYGAHGGIAKFNRDLIESIASTPGCAEVVCLPRLIPQPMQALPERVRYVTEAARSTARFLSCALKTLIQGPFDLVVIGHINLSPLGVWLARRQRAPSMLFIHGIDAWQRHHRNSVVRAMPHLDHVVGVSEVTLSRFRAWSGVPATRTSVLPNSVDLERFTPGPKAPDLVEQLALQGRTVLMTFGRLASEDRCKGFDEIIEVMGSLLEQRPELVYLICGTGPDQARLQAKCRQLGVDQAVRFSGFVPEARKVDYYRLADAYVMPSQGEGFGIVFLEAMACGIPAMGSSLDGGREALLDGQLGELVNAAVPAEVRAGIERTLARAKGRPDGLSLFSIHAFAGRVQQLIRNTLRPATTA